MPTVVIGNNTGDNYSGTEDAFITNNNGTANYGANENLYVWNVNPYANSLIRFTGLSNLSAEISVNSASLFLFNANNETNTYHYILKRLLRSWGEGNNSGTTADAGESCWDYYASTNSWSTAGGRSDGNDRSSTTTATFVSPVNSAYCEWTSDQLATDVQNFVDGTYTNNGWQVSSSDCQWGGFKSREYTDGRRPYLSVTYTESGGTQNLEGSFSSSSEFTGQAVLNIPIAGQFDAISQLTGEAYLQYFLTGAFNSVSNISGLAGLSLQAQGQIISLSSISGDAVLDIGISGQITCTSLLSLITSPEIFLQGAINSQSSIIGNIGLSLYISGIIPAVSFMEILEEFNYQILSFNSEIRNEIYISSEIRNELNIKSAIKSIIKIGANMSLIDYFYDGQNAIQIRVYELGDLSDATTCLIKYTKPNLTSGQWTAIIDTENEGEIYYDLLNTEFLTVGNWTFWSHITYSDGRIGIGDPKTITIREEGK